MLPLLLSGAVLLLLAGYTSRWDLHAPLGLAVFGLLLLALSLFLSIRLDALTLERRRRDGRRRWLNRTEPRWRLVKFVLGGALLPAAALIAASRLELPDHQTALARASLAVRSRLADPEVGRAARLGDAVLRAQSPAARAQGIAALQAMASGEALDQLLRVLSDDPTALSDVNESRALSAALASYGARPRTKLLQLLEAVPVAARRNAPALPGDPFEDEIAGRGPGLAAAHVPQGPPSAPAETPPSASPVESGSRGDQNPGRLPSFVIQTFLQTSLKEDAELLAFAQKTAADATWSDAVRGQALQLTAKLGGKDEMDGLFAYLDNPSARLQAHALKAIAALQAKLAASASKG